MTIVYLRNVGTDEDQCWVVCAKGDPGAVAFSADLNAAPNLQEPVGDASGSYMGTGSAHWNQNLTGR